MLFVVLLRGFVFKSIGLYTIFYIDRYVYAYICK